jgi:hypothetical protein
VFARSVESVASVLGNIEIMFRSPTTIGLAAIAVAPRQKPQQSDSLPDYVLARKSSRTSKPQSILGNTGVIEHSSLLWEQIREELYDYQD